MLWSWAVPKGIPLLNKPNHLAVRTEDHPLEYLTFHGEIPQGQYGAGSMTIWDSGTYEAEKLRDNEVIVTLHGKRVDGKYALFQTKGNQWMIHRMSPPADPSREPVPHDLRPMLATAAETLPPDQDELGVRDEVGRHAGDHRDRGGPAHAHLPARQRRHVALSGAARRLETRSAQTDMVLDGEIVALDDDGRPSFEQLQPRMQAGSASVARRLAAERPDGLHDLRPALARRPLHVRAAVHATGAKLLEKLALVGPDLADATHDDRRRRRRATPPRASSGWRVSSPSGSTAPTNRAVARTRGAR